MEELEPPDFEIPVTSPPREGLVTACTYDINTGEIMQVGSAFPSAAPPEPDRAYYFGELDDSTHYIDVATSEPALKTDSGVEPDATEITLGGTFTFSDIPDPCRMFVDNNGFVTITDGVLTLTPQSVGEYVVVLCEPRFFEKHWTLQVDLA